MHKEILDKLYSMKDTDKSEKLKYYFKTCEGGYAKTDKWLGIKNPEIRQVVKEYKKKISINDIIHLINNEFHEVRLFALLSLIELFNKGDITVKTEIKNIYLNNTKYINNWDLVDLSAYKIIGKYCLITNNFDILYELANSDDMWQQRIAIVSNWILFRNNKEDIFLNIAPKFIKSNKDLIHKAVGWMLREMGKTSDSGYKKLISFLDINASKMPRTMLRYSIERLDNNLKQKYMDKK